MTAREYLNSVFVRSPGEIPALTGFRGVAIFMLYYVHLFRNYEPQIKEHSTWFHDILHNILHNGSASIDMFFVLSGFLIAGPLLKELRRSGTINLKAFYIKRSLRIFPPYYIFLALQFFILIPYFATKSGEFGDMLMSTRWRIVFDLTYISNYFPGTLFHGWSLSLEEQFYMLFPLFLLVIFRRLPERFQLPMLWLLVLLPLSYRLYILPDIAAQEPHAPPYQARIYFPFHGHIDSVIIGIITAYIYQFRRHWIECIYERPLLKKTILGSAVLAFVLYSMFVFEYNPTIAGMVIRFPVFSILSAIIMVLSIPEGGWVNRFLSWKGFIPAAKLSYCAYIIHIVVMIPVSRKIFGGGEVFYYQIVLWFIPIGLVIFFFAYLFHLVAERPFMIWKERYTAQLRARRAAG